MRPAGGAPSSKLPAQPGERHVAGAGDHEVGVAADLLRSGLVADLRASHHQPELRRDQREQRDQPGGVLDVPDVDAEADDQRPSREDALGQRLGRGADDELQQLAARLQRAHVGVQVAQTQRRVAVAGIQRDEQDVGHGARAGGGRWRKGARRGSTATALQRAA